MSQFQPLPLSSRRPKKNVDKIICFFIFLTTLLIVKPKVGVTAIEFMTHPNQLLSSGLSLLSSSSKSSSKSLSSSSSTTTTTKEILLKKENLKGDDDDDDGLFIDDYKNDPNSYVEYKTFNVTKTENPILFEEYLELIDKDIVKVCRGKIDIDYYYKYTRQLNTILYGVQSIEKRYKESKLGIVRLESLGMGYFLFNSKRTTKTTDFFYGDLLCSKPTAPEFATGMALMQKAVMILMGKGVKKFALRASVPGLVPYYQQFGFQRSPDACNSMKYNVPDELYKYQRLENTTVDKKLENIPPVCDPDQLPKPTPPVPPHQEGVKPECWWGKNHLLYVNDDKYPHHGDGFFMSKCLI